MYLFDSIILGAVQGITEFLPVSSTAHTALFQRILSLNHFGRDFDILLNLGTLFALILYFRRDFFKFVSGGWDFLLNSVLHFPKKLCIDSEIQTSKLCFPWKWKANCSEEEDDIVFFVIIFVANLPTILLFLLLAPHVKVVSSQLTAINLIVFGIILYLCDQKTTDKKTISAKDAMKVGIAQMLSFFPGVSRLGICLSMCRYLGYSRQESFRFSMLLAIIPVAGACCFELIKIFANHTIDFYYATAGIISAFVFGIISLFFVNKFLQKHTLTAIVIYRIIFGIFVLRNLC